jgi:hypothetical protein
VLKSGLPSSAIIQRGSGFDENTGTTTKYTDSVLFEACRVNEILKYTASDIALYHITHACLSCDYVMILSNNYVYTNNPTMRTTSNSKQSGNGKNYGNVSNYGIYGQLSSLMNHHTENKYDVIAVVSEQNLPADHISSLSGGRIIGGKMKAQRKQHENLLALILRVDFLRKTDTQFLNSLPRRPNALDYFNVHTYILERLVFYKAKVKRLLYHSHLKGV